MPGPAGAAPTGPSRSGTEHHVTVRTWAERTRRVGWQRVRRSSTLTLAVALGAAGGCAPAAAPSPTGPAAPSDTVASSPVVASPVPSSSVVVQFVGVDAPPADVLVGRTLAGTVTCGRTISLRSDDPSLPLLPWKITVSLRNGHELGRLMVTGRDSPELVLVEAAGLVGGQLPGSTTPKPASPCPT